MKDSLILRIVKHRVTENRYNCFICNDIDNVAIDHTLNPAQPESLKRWIAEMLGPGIFTYEGWLRKNEFPINPHSAFYGRLAWLDWMIAYCEQEERTK